MNEEEIITELHKKALQNLTDRDRWGITKEDIKEEMEKIINRKFEEVNNKR
jgi:hypothetical protein